MSASGTAQRSGAGPRATSWAEVVRLRTLPAAVAPVILGAGAAAALGAFSPVRSLLAAGVALALQIGCNLANDYSDGVRGADDERTGPPRLTASGAVAPRTVKLAAFGCFGVGGLLGLALVALSGQWWLLAVGAAAIAAAWFYTGGPRPYGYAGLGEVFVFVFFGLVATAGTTFTQLLGVPWQSWLAACSVGSIACALLMVNNIRDIPTDAASGKRTLAVRLGDRRARTAYASAVALPVLAAAALWGDLGALTLLVLAPCLPLARAAIRPVLSGARGLALIPSLKATGFVELAYGVALLMAYAIARP